MKEQKEINVSRIITLLGEKFSLEIWVNENYEKADRLEGSIIYNYAIENPLDWDSLSYFVDITKEKKKDLKEELIELGIYEKGMFKELKYLFQLAKNEGLI